MKLSDNERVMMIGLAYECGSDDEPWCLSFKGIGNHTTLPKHSIRRTVRALARKGMTEYVRGLMNEDGEVRGAGYTLTYAGRKLARELAGPDTKWRD